MKRYLFAALALLLAAPAYAEKLTITKGTTSFNANFFIQDRSVTTAVKGRTGLTGATADLRCWFKREGGALTTCGLTSGGAVNTYTAGTLVEVSSTNAPGEYQLSIPDAAFAAGTSKWVTVHFGSTVDTTLDEIVLEFALVDYPTQADGLLLASSTAKNVLKLPVALSTGRVKQSVCFGPGSVNAGQCRCIISQSGGNTTVSIPFVNLPQINEPVQVGGSACDGPYANNLP